jgi:hypothetical protein
VKPVEVFRADQYLHLQDYLKHQPAAGQRSISQFSTLLIKNRYSSKELPLAKPSRTSSGTSSYFSLNTPTFVEGSISTSPEYVNNHLKKQSLPWRVDIPFLQQALYQPQVLCFHYQQAM